jgi:hypothetical protein
MMSGGSEASGMSGMSGATGVTGAAGATGAGVTASPPSSVGLAAIPV